MDGSATHTNQDHDGSREALTQHLPQFWSGAISYHHYHHQAAKEKSSSGHEREPVLFCQIAVGGILVVP